MSERGHSWNLALLSPSEPGGRNRRPVDAFFLLAGALVAGLTAVVASSAPGVDASVAEALATVLGWAGGLWKTVLVGLLALALVVVVDTIVRRRFDLDARRARRLARCGRNGVPPSALSRSPTGFRSKRHLLSHWGFPDLRLAAATAIVVVVGPELVRSVRRRRDLARSRSRRSARSWSAPHCPSEALGALALGLVAGALVRLVFGSAAGVPPVDDRAKRAGGARRRGDRARRRREQQRIGSAAYVGPRRRGRPLQGARARPRRTGRAAARPALAPPLLPGSASQRRRSGASSRSSTRPWRR